MPQFWISLHRQFRKFRDSEDGVVNTDWIVLTGAITGVSLSAMFAVRTGVTDLGLSIQGSLAGAQIATLNIAAPALAAPLRWIEVENQFFPPVGCPPRGENCTSDAPGVQREKAALELVDGTVINRITESYFNHTTGETISVRWEDEDGNTIEGPKDTPDLDMNNFDCTVISSVCILPTPSVNPAPPAKK